MESYPIHIEGGPESPNIGYYSKTNTDTTNSPNNYSYDTLNNNLLKSCVTSIDNQNIKDTTGIYSNPNDQSVSAYLPPNTSSLDIPFYLAKSGVLMDSNNNANLSTQVQNYCNSKTQDTTPIVNQIQYLTCQLEKERNREYDPSETKVLGNGMDLKKLFKKYSNLKPFLIVIFIVTIYLLVSGFLGSMDLATNIFDVVSKSSNRFNYSYWFGLLIGIIAPIIVLCIVYSKIICTNLSELEKYEITNNPYGEIKNIPSVLKRLDFVTLILFIFVIYALVALLFTIQKSYFSIYIYTFLIAIVLSIITIFIYILYAYVPFFNTANENNLLNTDSQSLRLFVDDQKYLSEITSNQTQNNNVKYAYLLTSIFIILLTILFFIFGSKNLFFSGLLSSSAILSLPILWIFNFIIGINLFYIYPMLYILIRFVRYILMSIIYIISEKNNSLKSKFSDDLIYQLDNFKNYSPTWGLIGVDELKLLLNICGYENLFSKEIIDNDDEGKNVSQNRFVSSGFLTYIINLIAKKETNTKGIIYGVIIFVLTLLVSIIILYGIIKI